MQEECGGGGARASVWNAKPDMAIAMDVCHAPTPGIKPFDAIDITKVSITCGPNIHPKMFKMITEAADEQNIPWDYDVAPRIREPTHGIPRYRWAAWRRVLFRCRSGICIQA